MLDMDTLDPGLLQRLLDVSNDGIVVAEREGDDHIALYVNDAFERLTGYNRDDILYNDCRFLQWGETDQPGLDELRLALRDHQPCRVVLRKCLGAACSALFSLQLEFPWVLHTRGICSNAVARCRAQRRVIPGLCRRSCMKRQI